MAYDLEEQEQLEAIKAWWERYGNLIVAAVVAVALAVAGYQGWRYYRQTQSVGAATLYGQLEEATRANDHKRVRDIATQVVDRYGSTVYGGLAALAAAKAAFTTGDLEAAEKQLRWAAEHAKEPAQRDVARLRLAGVLLDQKKPDEALKQLDQKPQDGYAPLYADLKGDILATQGKKGEAAAAYRVALEKSDAASAYRQVVEIKLDALGDVK
jgi:predicted negative regulator of RcsB-dependent stress response